MLNIEAASLSPGSVIPPSRAASAPAQPIEMFSKYPGLEKAGSLDELREFIGDCRRCKLWGLRKNLVFGVGNPKAELMFVGEAPGADEDARGEPFVGRAGQLLTDIIEPRMEEIFAMAQREIMRSGVADSLASGIVLVGGSSLLEGTQELAERIFGVPVRRGLPINLKGMPEELMKPMYTTAAGLILYQGASRGASGVNGRHGRLGRLRSRLGEWVRDFF